MVRNVLYRLTGKNDLDDLTQDTFERLWKNRAKFRLEASPKTWIYAMATNAAIDHLRKRRHRAHLEFVDEAHGRFDGDGAQSEAVQRALMALSPEHRIALVLFVLEGLTHDEIAHATGVPVGTVKSRVHHARERMKALLGHDGRDA